MNRVEDILALLAHRREVAADATKVLRVLETAETAGDLSLHLVHLNVLFTLIVRERNLKIPLVRFHTLRACFATQPISSGVPATVVMKIAGWKDMKPLQRYIRMAGIDEAGATESLRLIPTDEAVMEHVVNMIDYKAKKGE